MPALSPAQLRVLNLVSRAEVIQETIGFSWCVEADYESVTSTIYSLVRRGLVEERPVGGDPRLAVLTDAGRALLDSLTDGSE